MGEVLSYKHHQAQKPRGKPVLKLGDERSSPAVRRATVETELWGRGGECPCEKMPSICSPIKLWPEVHGFINSIREAVVGIVRVSAVHTISLSKCAAIASAGMTHRSLTSAASPSTGLCADPAAYRSPRYHGCVPMTPVETNWSDSARGVGFGRVVGGSCPSCCADRPPNASPKGEERGHSRSHLRVPRPCRADRRPLINPFGRLSRLEDKACTGPRLLLWARGLGCSNV